MDNEEKLSGSLAAIFNEFTEYAQADQDIRDQIKLKVRELEQGNREAVAILAKIHHADGLKNMEDLLKNVEELVRTKIQERISALSTVIPKGQYFRFHNHFNYRWEIKLFDFAKYFSHSVESAEILSYQKISMKSTYY